ncbi:hypothetical protein CEXT_515841, partial [Caerostris extrusa]
MAVISGYAMRPFRIGFERLHKPDNAPSDACWWLQTDAFK